MTTDEANKKETLWHDRSCCIGYHILEKIIELF
jgi:hypothetical protein